MPYKKFKEKYHGQVVFAAKNIKTGVITHFKTEKARANSIRVREAIAHGFKLTKRN